jgi:hypothetical protein
MRKIMTVLAVLSVFTGLALAETFTGKLLDAGCYTQQKTAKGCEATSATSMYAIDVAGKVYKLEDSGNKVATAVRNSADRAKDPAKPPAGGLQAKVTGAVSGESITVESIEVQ